MKIFALDTSSKVATIGILEDEKVLLENTLNDKKTHSENLMPMIEAAFQSVNLTPKDIDVFGVTIGPGAFTGIRIGISTIKGMAEALGKPVVGLSALEVFAAGIPPTDRIICPILDAQRNQVYAGLYQYRSAEDSENPLPTGREKSEADEVKDAKEGEDAKDTKHSKGIKDTENAINVQNANDAKNAATIAKISQTATLTVIRDTEVIKIADLVAVAAKLDKKILFVGDGLNLHGDTLAEGLGERFEKPLFANQIPRASVVGELTRRKHLEGKSHGAEELKPVYLRKSQAEVQFDERQKVLGKEGSAE